MKQKTGKTAALFIVSIMALAGTSAGYALWWDELYIDGYIETGTLCAEFTFFDISDYPGRIDLVCDDGIINIREVVPPKDVGSMTGAISPDGQTLTVTYDNVYPGYFGNINFHVHNCGTIAWILDHIDVYLNGQYLTTYDESNAPSGVFTHVFGDDFEVYYGNHIGDQVHPCTTIDISMAFHLLQGAEQDETYHFELRPCIRQYNEEWTGGYP